MYDIDLNRYTEVVDSAIALRPQIEKAVDEICAQGYSNLFFIGCGGTYAHSLPMMYWLESTTNKVEAHADVSMLVPDCRAAQGLLDDFAFRRICSFA